MIKKKDQYKKVNMLDYKIEAFQNNYKDNLAC